MRITIKRLQSVSLYFFVSLAITDSDTLVHHCSYNNLRIVTFYYDALPTYLTACRQFVHIRG